MPENRPLTLSEAAGPAWSLAVSRDEMVVSVSPVRQSIQILGSSGALLGMGIDAVVNDKYRRRVNKAMGDYDPSAVLEERLASRLSEAVPNISRAAPLGSTAGYQTKRDAEKVRYERLAKTGRDMLLDIKATYGIFGYEGILVAKLDAKLLLLPEGKKVWKNTIVASAESVLAHDKLSDPTKQLGPNLSSPRFKVADDAIEQWTGDGGKELRRRFEESMDGALSAMLTDTGLAEEALGEYYLGKGAMNRKKFTQADAHFRKAMALKPGFTEAQSAWTVNLAHNGQVDEAIVEGRKLTEAAPEFGPPWFNLAWWYAVEKDDPKAAQPFYTEALALGMPENAKIEKALGKQ
ncbi:MAG: hypothetical protein GWP08_12055 [Nitrospiraceae bacterium]|nr:hypothetical protein [Nitrospiraceae bacterium]